MMKPIPKLLLHENLVAASVRPSLQSLLNLFAQNVSISRFDGSLADKQAPCLDTSSNKPCQVPLLPLYVTTTQQVNSPYSTCKMVDDF